MSKNESQRDTSDDELSVDGMLQELDEFIEDNNLSDAEVISLYTDMNTHFKKLLATEETEDPLQDAEEMQRRMQAGIIALVTSLYRTHTGQVNPEQDWITQHQKERLQSGDEPFDVLFAVDEEGIGKLDPEFAAGMLALLLERFDKQDVAEVQNVSDLRRNAAETLKAIDYARRRFYFDSTRMSPVGWYRHVPVTEVLAGENGEEDMISFAHGALSAMEQLIQSVVDDSSHSRSVD